MSGSAEPNQDPAGSRLCSTRSVVVVICLSNAWLEAIEPWARRRHRTTRMQSRPDIRRLRMCV